MGHLSDPAFSHEPRPSGRPTVAVVASAHAYRIGDFVTAATALRLDPIVVSDATGPIERVGVGRMLRVDLTDPVAAAARVARLRPPPDAVVAVDDRAVETAARAAGLLGLPHNPPSAAAATRDKLLARRRLAAAGVLQPVFDAAGPGEVAAVAAAVGFPAVVKPRTLSASRGVIRVDDPEAADAAEARIRAIVADAGEDPSAGLLVEQFVPGAEVAIEGLLLDGDLEILAVIDKPDPMEGPVFEETLLVTPSRHADAIVEASIEAVRQAVAALGLVEGPIHAEVRLAAGGPRILEVAARSIGGLCGRSFLFGLLGESLESVILRGALRLPIPDRSPARPASGVLMLPIPRPGVLRGFEGAEDALAVPGIVAFEPTIPVGRKVAPLPEGDRYLAFLFAEGLSADAVERSLREAWERIEVLIDGGEGARARC